MGSAVFGAIAALSWGSADFIARFTGRAMGHLHALFGMFLVGAVTLSIVVWYQQLPLNLENSGWWLLLVAGIGVMLATLLLYWGLARGPVTIVAPIVGSYPLFNVCLAFFTGSTLSAIQWLAVVVVIAGIWLVAQASSNVHWQQQYEKNELKKTVWIALASAFIFGISIAAVQSASLVYGEIQTVCITRWIGLLFMLFIFLGKKENPAVPLAWWPLVAVQGLLDASAYLAISAGSHSPHPAITAVAASAFCAVTVILARTFLKEAMSWAQWLGVLFVVTGVAVLSAI